MIYTNRKKTPEADHYAIGFLSLAKYAMSIREMRQTHPSINHLSVNQS